MEHEQMLGQYNFIVSISMDDGYPVARNKLINWKILSIYQLVYNVVKEQMEIRSEN